MLQNWMITEKNALESDMGKYTSIASNQTNAHHNVSVVKMCVDKHDSYVTESM